MGSIFKMFWNLTIIYSIHALSADDPTACLLFHSLKKLLLLYLSDVELLFIAGSDIFTLYLLYIRIKQYLNELTVKEESHTFLYHGMVTQICDHLHKCIKNNKSNFNLKITCCYSSMLSSALPLTTE